MRRKWLILLTMALMFSGCSNRQVAPAEPPGILIGLEYSRSGGMERGNDFYIRIMGSRIEALEYSDPEDLEDIRLKDLPLDAQIWESIETTVAQMWPALEEKAPQKKRSRLHWILNGFWFGEPMILDGGDSTELSLVWETEEGALTIPYRWDNSDPLYNQLVVLLEALAPNKT